MFKFPYFPFYPGDWLADEKVQTMSMAGEGCYAHLLSICWRERSIPADRSAIVLLCKNYDGPGIDEALLCFSKSKINGRLINKRLELERKKMEEFHKAKKMAGLKGAGIRWQGHGSAINKVIANDGSSSSSSSSNINKKKNILVSPKIILNLETKEWENITEEDKALWRKTFPKLNIDFALQEMIGYYDANRDKVKIRWKRTIFNRLSWLQDHGQRVTITPEEQKKIEWEKRNAAIDEAEKGK